ncbi:MAG TPA: hypothetical protein PLF42_13105 [Anaerolineales bacterium]|nr:hypothetical protein [Anaerolineales bacterium]
MNLLENGFILPLHTTYNAGQIPFAYPPLGFYLAAAISSLFNLSVFDVLRIVPAFISALCIPAFYLLASEALKSKAQIAVAVVIFAFIPRVFAWQIMGGGITRATGFLFALLAMREFYRMYAKRDYSRLGWAVLFPTLGVYTHPEAAVHIAVSALTLYLLMDRSRNGFVTSAWIAVGTVIFTAPWWATVISRHGAATLLAPITAVQQDSIGIFSRIFMLIGFQFTYELFLNIAAILGLLGAAVALKRGEHHLVAWLACIFLVEPRGGTLYVMIPHALLAAMAVEGLILPGLRNSSAHGSGGGNWAENLLGDRASKIVLGYIFIYGIMSAFMASSTIANKFTLTSLDMEALQWVKNNTTVESRFLLVTHEAPLRDSTSEWFPTLTDRRSQATVFGYEWIDDGKFSARIDAYNALQKCASRDETCLTDWSRQTGIEFDYVYIRKFAENTYLNPALIFSLQTSGKYDLVFDSEGAAVFKAR